MKGPYFDLQVNGYGGVDFNRDDLTAQQLHAACAALQRDGVEGILATVITERLDVMCRRIGRLVELREQDEAARCVVSGIHVEGPFINPMDGYRGAHPGDAVRAATADDASKLLDAGRGLVRLVTLAPEVDDNAAVTRLLVDRGVVVSAGHTDASTEQLRAAIDAGLSMFTHLGNGCPMQLPRHDNIIQRVLSLREKLWITFIADGVHVPFVALRNYLDLIAPDRAIIVTDAVAPAGLGPGRYTLGRWDLSIGPDMVARAPDGSHLIGSAITMQQSERNLAGSLGLSDAHCRRVVYDNPREKILGTT